MGTQSGELTFECLDGYVDVPDQKISWLVVGMPLAGADQEHGAGADPGLPRARAMDCCAPDDNDDLHELVHVRELGRVVGPMLRSGHNVPLT